MKPVLLALTIAAMLSLGACKKTDDASAVEAAAEPATGPAQDAGGSAPTNGADPAEDGAKPDEADSQAARARKEQQDKLDYATTEDGYINDANGQWATSATASSSFGDANDAEPDSHDGNTPWRATGAPDGDNWTNNSQDVGFDWIKLKYDNAVAPAEVRAVFSGNEAPEAITKVELIDTAGKSHVVWSGLSDTGRDERGQRTWFVRTVENADYTADTVKLTFANNVASGYKTVDAVQLVAK
jgi:hypothetical protein